MGARESASFQHEPVHESELISHLYLAGSEGPKGSLAGLPSPPHRQLKLALSRYQGSLDQKVDALEIELGRLVVAGLAKDEMGKQLVDFDAFNALSIQDQVVAFHVLGTLALWAGSGGWTKRVHANAGYKVNHLVTGWKRGQRPSAERAMAPLARLVSLSAYNPDTGVSRLVSTEKQMGIVFRRMVPIRRLVELSDQHRVLWRQLKNKTAPASRVVQQENKAFVLSLPVLKGVADRLERAGFVADAQLYREAEHRGSVDYVESRYGMLFAPTQSMQKAAKAVAYQGLHNYDIEAAHLALVASSAAFPNLARLLQDWRGDDLKRPAKAFLLHYLNGSRCDYGSSLFQQYLDQYGGDWDKATQLRDIFREELSSVTTEIDTWKATLSEPPHAVLQRVTTAWVNSLIARLGSMGFKVYSHEHDGFVTDAPEYVVDGCARSANAEHHVDLVIREKPFAA